MQAERGDYIVVQQGEWKKTLALVMHHERSGGYIACRINRRFRGMEHEPHLTVDEDDVLAVLGKRPHSGIVYGVLAEPLLRSESVEPWGQVHWFRELEPDDRYVFDESLNIAHDILAEANLTTTLPLDIEVRSPRGQYAGVYYYNEKEGDSIEFRPREFESADLMAELIVHEMGHSVWFRLLNSAIHAKWIGLYTGTMRLYKTTPKQIERMFHYLVQDGNVNQCKSNLPSDKVDLFVGCMEHLKRLKGLEPKHVNKLLATGRESLEKLRLLWPRTAIDVLSTANEEDGITDYAKKNVEEFFAETFRVRLVHGRGRLPSKVDAFLDKSLAVATRR